MGDLDRDGNHRGLRDDGVRAMKVFTSRGAVELHFSDEWKKELRLSIWRLIWAATIGRVLTYARPYANIFKWRR